MKANFSWLVLIILLVVSNLARAGIDQNPVYSQDTTITYGQSFTPSYFGGTGTGGWQFTVGGQTNFNPGNGQPSGTQLLSGSWVPSWTPSAAGSYSFYIANNGDNDYNPASAGWYNLTVNKANQPPVSSSNAIITYNSGYPSFTPQYFGGAGTGAWQFSVLSQTNWNPGQNQPGGTEISAGNWQSSWTPSVGGTYTFYVANNGDGNYNTSSFAGPYYLTVNGPANGVQWISIPTVNGSSGQSVPYSVTVKNTGTTTWDGNYYIEEKDGNGTHLYYASLSGVTPGNSTTVTIQLTLPTNAATYTYYLTAEQVGVEYFGGTQPVTVNVASIPATFSAAPLSFMWDGNSHGPTVTSSPAAAVSTASYAGDTAAINQHIGYQLLVVGQGAYYGSFAGFSWDIVGANQSTVSVTPSSITVTPGTSVTFTVTGGSGAGAYAWGGQATGSGTTNTVTFPNVGGPYYVTVYRALDNHYVQSNTATATIQVQATGNVTVVGGTKTVNGSIYTLTANDANTGTIFNGWTADSGTLSDPHKKVTSYTPVNNFTSSTVTANFTAIVANTDVNGNTIPDELEIAAGMLDPNNPLDPSDLGNKNASQNNYSSYQYDNNSQVTSAPEGGFAPDAEGNIKPQ